MTLLIDTLFRATEPFDLLVLKLPRATLGPDADPISRPAALRKQAA